MKTHQRFLAKIKKVQGGCWEWQGSLTAKGYGQFSFDGKSGRAHRYSFVYFKGAIPQDKVIDHLCNNRKCVNPKHLRVCSTRENVLRGVGCTANNSKKVKCPRGHSLSGKNLYLRKRGENSARLCRTCQRAANILWLKRIGRGNGISAKRLMRAINDYAPSDLRNKVKKQV